MATDMLMLPVCAVISKMRPEEGIDPQSNVCDSHKDLNYAVPISGLVE